MSFKLPSLNGRVSSDKSLNREGLPLFDWHHSKDKEDAIGRGSFGGAAGICGDSCQQRKGRYKETNK